MKTIFKTIALILLEIWVRIQSVLASIILLITGIISPKRFLQAIESAGNAIKTKEYKK